MKDLFLIAGVAVLAYAVFHHHKAPVLAQEGTAKASQLSAGMDGTSSPALNDLSAPSMASTSGACDAGCDDPASIAPLDKQTAGDTRRDIQPVAGRQYSSFFHPLEL